MNEEIIKRLKDSLDYEFQLSFKDRKQLLDYIINLQQENERLNNIINELEEYVCVIEYDERFYNETWQIAVRIHNKLKELKDSDDK
jgi:RecJ-like exonuclease